MEEGRLRGGLVNPTEYQTDPEQNKNQSKNRNASLNIGCWNIRKGITTKEQEIIHLLKVEKLDILFLTEVDSRSLQEECEYNIQGFKTIFHLREKKEVIHRGLPTTGSSSL